MIKYCLTVSVLLMMGVWVVNNSHAQPATFGSAEEAGFTLKGDIYLLKSGTASLPDFKQMKSVGRIYAKELNFPNRSFREGFPGVTDRYEWFGLEYKGVFYLPEEGRYRFRLTSDDGSQLYIDEKMVIDNDGQHEARPMEATIPLSAGRHGIRVKYFQGPATEIALVLEVARGDGPYEIFNTDRLSPVTLSEENGDIHIVLGDAILFDSGTHTLKETARDVLMELKSSTFDKHAEGHIAIDGHTDDVGSDDVNLSLSLKRAQAVADWLMANGVRKDRVLVVGYGEGRPRCSGVTDVDRACNRRVEIRVMD